MTGRATTTLMARIEARAHAILQPGDKMVFERELIYETYSVYSQETPEHFSLLEMGDSTAFEQDARRVWAIYRIRFEDFHRQDWATGIDPLTPGMSPISDWLIARQDRICDMMPFKGGAVYLLRGSDADHCD